MTTETVLERLELSHNALVNSNLNEREKMVEIVKGFPKMRKEVNYDFMNFED